MKTAPDSVMYYKAYSTYALTYSAINQYDSSLLLSHQVINFCKRQELSPRIYELLASSNNNIGVYYGQMSVPDSALYYFKEALKQYELANNTNRIPDMYINLADMYSRKGDFAMSAYYYRKALSKSDSLKITDKTGSLIAIKDVDDNNDLMIINKSGITIRIGIKDLRILGRATQGVRLIKLNETDEIAAVCKIDITEDDEDVERAVIDGEEIIDDGTIIDEEVDEVEEIENEEELEDTEETQDEDEQ
jgi:tetratricopeptide (TPR) repeat protein